MFLRWSSSVGTILKAALQRSWSSSSGTVSIICSMELRSVVQALEAFAPLKLAESWDNVGLLVEPLGHQPQVRSIMLTNDLTEPVLAEAVQNDVQMIVSYHPPIFGSALKRLTCATWKERILVGCIERRIAIYSPHTCWDAAVGGVNDWLTGAFATSSVRPITTSVSSSPAKNSHLVELDVPRAIWDQGTHGPLWHTLLQKASSSPDAHMTSIVENQDQLQMRFSCQESLLDDINGLLINTELFPFLRITKLIKLPSPNVGMGRLCTLQRPLTLSEAIQAIKDHLQMKLLRVAIGHGKSMDNSFVSQVALCAGSGSSVLRHAPSADLYWTGEMSHHDVLDIVQRGITVILCEHTNTERGFLRHFAPKFKQMLDDRVDILVSSTDADPLSTA